MEDLMKQYNEYTAILQNLKPTSVLPEELVINIRTTMQKFKDKENKIFNTLSSEDQSIYKGFHDGVQNLYDTAFKKVKNKGNNAKQLQSAVINIDEKGQLVQEEQKKVTEAKPGKISEESFKEKMGQFEKTYDQILSNLQSRELKSVEVLDNMHKQINSLTEDFTAFYKFTLEKKLLSREQKGEIEKLNTKVFAINNNWLLEKLAAEEKEAGRKEPEDKSPEKKEGPGAGLLAAGIITAGAGIGAAGLAAVTGVEVALAASTTALAIAAPIALAVAAAVAITVGIGMLVDYAMQQSASADKGMAR